MNKLLYKERRRVERRKQPMLAMMHLFMITATTAAVQELDCLAISGFIRTKTLFNAHTMIFEIEGCLLCAYILCVYIHIYYVEITDEGLCRNV